MTAIYILLVKLFDSTETLIATVKDIEVLNQKSPLLVKHMRWSHRIKSKLWNGYCINGQCAQLVEVEVNMGICHRKVFLHTGNKAMGYTCEVDIQQAIDESICYHTKSIERLKMMQQYIDHLSSTEHSARYFSGPAKETSVETKQLETCYKLLQADLKRSSVKFIQTVYKDQDRSKIVVDVKKGYLEASCETLKNLENSDNYYKYLDVVECDPGELLMQAGHVSNLESDFPKKHHPQYNIRIGSGSLIGCITACNEELQGLIKDKDLKSISDIQKKYPTTRGTLTCIVKQRAKYYTMTAQHVLDKKNFFSNEKHIFSQVHYTCPELLLADIVHLASCYSGQMNVISVNDSDKAVDVALMPMRQNNLDEALLVRLPVYYRRHFNTEVLDSDKFLMNKRVRKIGAVTGENEGKIILTDCLVPLDPDNEDSPKGQMFVVVGLSNTTKPFAEQGDSGSLVTIQLKKNGRNYTYALGIIAQLRRRLLGHTNVTLCVCIEDCLNGLASATPLDDDIDSKSLELYAGFLRPLAGLHDRTVAHMEVASTSATDGAAT